MTQYPTEQPGGPAMTLAATGGMAEDEPGELADSRLVDDEDVGALHDMVAAWLVWVLKSWLGPRGGFVLLSNTRFGVAPRRGRKPDTSVYFAGRKPPAHGLVTTPPDIMIEVVSPRSKD